MSNRQAFLFALILFAMLGCSEESLEADKPTATGEAENLQKQLASTVESPVNKRPNKNLAVPPRLLTDKEIQLPAGFVPGPWPPPEGGGVIVMPPGSLGTKIEDAPHFKDK